MSPSRSPEGGVTVAYERRAGRLAGVTITGHAGFAPAGRDVVCAAVSALVLTAAHGLRAHCGVRPKLVDTPEYFSLQLARRDQDDERAQAVLATMLSGIEAVARSYPGHITVRSRTAKATGPRRQDAKATRSKARRRPSSAADTVER